MWRQASCLTWSRASSPAGTRFQTTDTLENPTSIGRQDAALHGRQGCLPLPHPRTFDFSDTPSTNTPGELV